MINKVLDFTSLLLIIPLPSATAQVINGIQIRARIQNCVKCYMKNCWRLFMKVTNERLRICKYDFVIAIAMHI